MDVYPLIKPLLHQLPPELAHQWAVRAIGCGAVPFAPWQCPASLATELAGLKLPNPIGLAAGFDKNAQTLPHIFKAGFGFVECGTVTPRPQAGNPKPRMFRLSEHQAVINRLGFNNAGLEAFVPRLQAHADAGIIGANIGKNKDSTDAVADYVVALRAVYAHAAYVTVNISSPNTQGLRDLQAEQPLRELVSAVQAERAAIMATGQAHKPIFVKIAPDLSQAQQESIAALAIEMAVDGLIVSNTTISRDVVAGHPLAGEAGGLSGKPLMTLSTQVLATIYRLTGGNVPLIGVGGIASAEDAYAKICAGASAVQLYSALAYQGFGLIQRIGDGLTALLKRDGFASINEAVGSSA